MQITVWRDILVGPKIQGQNESTDSFKPPNDEVVPALCAECRKMWTTLKNVFASPQRIPGREWRGVWRRGCGLGRRWMRGGGRNDVRLAQRRFLLGGCGLMGWEVVMRKRGMFWLRDFVWTKMDIKLIIMTMDCAYADRMLNSCSESSRKFVADLKIGRNRKFQSWRIGRKYS